jgi:hypothetical protein
VRRSVFSISRTIESSRFAITASSTGSKPLTARPFACPSPRGSQGAQLPERGS